MNLARDPEPSAGDWKVELARLAFRAGPFFVVTLLLLWGIWEMFRYMTTEGIHQIQGGYERMSAEDAKQREETRKVFRDAIEQVSARLKEQIDILKQDQELHRESQKLLKGAIDELRRDRRPNP